MKNKVGRKLAKTWLGKSLIRVGQKVDEVWMGIGQYLVRSWSAFKANKVGQNLDESWMDFGRVDLAKVAKLGRTVYAKGMPKICQNSVQRLLQLFSNTSPEIDQQRLHRSYTNPTPEFKRFSLKKVSQQLPNDYPENEGFSLNNIRTKSRMKSVQKIASTLR